MWSFVIAFAILIIFAIALLPGIGFRSRIVMLLCLAVQLLLVAAVGAAGTFSIRPDWTPSWLNEWIAPVVKWLASMDPNGFVKKQPYLALGIVTSAVGLPLLVLLDTSRHQAAVVALLNRISRQLRKSRQPVQRDVPANFPMDEILAKLNDLRRGRGADWARGGPRQNGVRVPVRQALTGAVNACLFLLRVGREQRSPISLEKPGFWTVAQDRPNCRLPSAARRPLSCGCVPPSSPAVPAWPRT